MSIFLIILHSFSRCVRLIDGSQKVVGFLPVNLRSLLHKSQQIVRWQEITDAIISIGNELSCPQSHDPRLAFRKWCQDIGVLSQTKRTICDAAEVSHGSPFTRNGANWGIRGCRIC